MHEVIFEADTPAGKAFDVVLLIVIVVSVIVVMFESVAEIRQSYRLPLVVSMRTSAFAVITVVVATIVSALAVRRKLDRLDLIAVLKTRE